ncbi:MAG: MupG family TIM beta-alpha barrel fold protein, partial [Erysipelotrichaceae bacterium]|nr:MupG family TIM beta-alpha barrel fold protein [Erysipelotrichaceae bacterium]
MSQSGISVYPDLRPLAEIREYFALAARYGFKRVFSSMFSVEGTNEEIVAYFRDLIASAHQYDMEVSLDVNPAFLGKLGVSPEDLSLFADIKCDILRMDLSYGKEKDLILCQNPYGIKIQLNASMGIEEELKYLKENGVDSSRLLLGHNFYPQRYTGLKWKAFIDTN